MRHFVSLFLFCSLIVFFHCSEPQQSQEPVSVQISAEIVHLLNAWYPRAVDESNGGFHPVWTWNWEDRDDGKKGIVTQARHTWSAAQAAMRFPARPHFRQAAETGYQFLRSVLWDSVYGGFYEYREDPVEDHQIQGVDDTKRTYGNAFGIYALSAYFELTGDTSALLIAQKTFYWLESHAYDPEYGGYFNHLKRSGLPAHLDFPPRKIGSEDGIGWKDYNSSIHILEAYTGLYRIWPDSLLNKKLTELFIRIRDGFVTERGFLHLFFQSDWTPVSYRDSSETVRNSRLYFDHVSFGHDLETAYLLIEAAKVLGLPEDPAFQSKTRLMVDHAIRYGWDNRHGGFFESAYYLKGNSLPTIVDRQKTWWVQAEALNALLLMAGRYPEDPKYRSYFEKQWQYIKKYLIDQEYGGWYSDGLDHNRKARKYLKGHHWKASYHDLRALLNCEEMLRENICLSD
jgi:mannobiose 2-epimerase